MEVKCRDRGTARRFFFHCGGVPTHLPPLAITAVLWDTPSPWKRNPVHFICHPQALNGDVRCRLMERSPWNGQIGKPSNEVKGDTVSALPEGNNSNLKDMHICATDDQVCSEERLCVGHALLMHPTSAPNSSRNTTREMANIF